MKSTYKSQERMQRIIDWLKNIVTPKLVFYPKSV
jgi:hypothetical protein